jgi:hypothetical protein
VTSPAPAPALTRTAITAAEDLRAVREQWGDLLHAIAHRPASEWPPRDSRALGVEPDPAGPTIGRTPLTLREHPAPLNLDALDAALSVERALFEQADRIAATVQRPVRREPWPGQGNRTPAAVDADDRDDPARWHYQAPTSPGSRQYGLHWAAVWIEGRILDEQHGDMFRPLPPLLLDEAATTARAARRAVDDALQRAGQTTALDDPCPWCGGQLTARTRAGDPEAAVIVCSTGEPCGAPVVLDHGRRTWQRETLVGLWVALDARRRGEQG